MKAITLWQPWATMIATGLKVIETRTHNRFASLKGQRIAIHAGKKWDTNAIDAVAEAGRLMPSWIFDKSAHFFGMVICTVRVEDFFLCRLEHSHDACIDCEGTLRYGLELADVKVILHPVLAKGSQGIWNWNESWT